MSVLVWYCARVVMDHDRGHDQDLSPLRDGQGLQESLHRCLGSLNSDIEDARAVESGTDGGVVQYFSYVRLFATKVRNERCRTSPDAPFYGPIHYRLNRVSGERGAGGSGLDGASCLQEYDGERFVQPDETAVLPGPPRHDDLHAVTWAATLLQAANQSRRELHWGPRAASAARDPRGRRSGRIPERNKPCRRGKGAFSLAGDRAEGQQHRLGRRRPARAAGHSASTVPAISAIYITEACDLTGPREGIPLRIFGQRQKLTRYLVLRTISAPVFAFTPEPTRLS